MQTAYHSQRSSSSSNFPNLSTEEQRRLRDVHMVSARPLPEGPPPSPRILWFLEIVVPSVEVLEDNKKMRPLIEEALKEAAWDVNKLNEQEQVCSYKCNDFVEHENQKRTFKSLRKAVASATFPIIVKIKIRTRVRTVSEPLPKTKTKTSARLTSSWQSFGPG